MKLDFRCWQCPEGTPGRHVTAPFNDSGFYRFQCAENHVHEIVLVQMRFEVLAETAMQAIVDGYYRDAVASFAAALERFYQFYIDVVAHSKGVAPVVQVATWKHVVKQSERQLGMFIGVYQLENGDVPPLLDQNRVKLRNQVIHQGYLPTEEDAIDFGQAVVDLIQPLINQMMPRYITDIEALTNVHTAAASAKSEWPGRKHLVYFEFILRFDTEADEWDVPPADVRTELEARRNRQL